jgi:Holliday junction resolvase RusA-like endonuclease
VKITIIIPPKGQMRARNRGFMAGGRICSRTHKAEKQEQEEERLITLLLEHRPAMPLEGPLMLGVRAFLPIPASRPKKWQAAALSREVRPVTTPDLDNLIKHVKDCCKGIFWVDDKQVVGYLPETGKFYGKPPRWEIEIITLEEYRSTLMQRCFELTAENYVPEKAVSGQALSGGLF